MPYARPGSFLYRSWYSQQLGQERRGGGGSQDEADPELTLQMQTTTSSESITLPMTGAVNVNIDWGDGTTETVTTDSPSHTFATAGTYDIKVTGSCDLFAFNNGGDKDKLLAVLNGGSGFTAGSWAGGFFNCDNLETADFAGLDTSSVTNMFRMFQSCSSLTSLDISGFDTSSVKNMGFMFRSCSSLTSDPGIHAFDVTALTDAGNMCLSSNDMLSETEYNTILVNWEAQAVNDNVAVHFGNAEHSGAGTTARSALITDHTWTITDGGAA